MLGLFIASVGLFIVLVGLFIVLEGLFIVLTTAVPSFAHGVTGLDSQAKDRPRSEGKPVHLIPMAPLSMPMSRYNNCIFTHTHTHTRARAHTHTNTHTHTRTHTHTHTHMNACP